MPTINGMTFPELNIDPAPNTIFRVMLLSADESYLYSLTHKLEILKHYVSDIGADFEIEIRVTTLKRCMAEKKKRVNTLKKALISLVACMAWWI